MINGDVIPATFDAWRGESSEMRLLIYPVLLLLAVAIATGR